MSKMKIRRKTRTTRTRKCLETKPFSKNLIQTINSWEVSLVRYSGPFLKWKREELGQINQKTRKLMTMHKTLHRLYGVKKRRREGGIASIRDCVDVSI